MLTADSCVRQWFSGKIQLCHTSDGLAVPGVRFPLGASVLSFPSRGICLHLGWIFFVVASGLLASRWRIHSAGDVRGQNTTQIMRTHLSRHCGTHARHALWKSLLTSLSITHPRWPGETRPVHHRTLVYHAYYERESGPDPARNQCASQL